MHALRDFLLLKQRPGESLRSFTHRFTDFYLQLPKVIEMLVVDAFDAGTTNRKVVEDLMLSPGPATIARLF
jgi:anthranilate/para-aminobenzoate synthase component II